MKTSQCLEKPPRNQLTTLHFPKAECSGSPASLGLGIWVSVTLFSKALPTVMFMAARSWNLAIAAT